MIGTLKDLATWGGGLSILPKLLLSFLIVNLCFFALVLLWYRPPPTAPWNNPTVVTAYDRMARVLKELPQNRTTVDDLLLPYYAIAAHIEKHPGDVRGVYEKVWEHGGGNRVFSSSTERYENVVSAFFETFRTAEAAAFKR